MCYSANIGSVDTTDQFVRWFTCKQNLEIAYDDDLQRTGHQCTKLFYCLDFSTEKTMLRTTAVY